MLCSLFSKSYVFGTAWEFDFFWNKLFLYNVWFHFHAWRWINCLAVFVCVCKKVAVCASKWCVQNVIEESANQSREGILGEAEEQARAESPVSAQSLGFFEPWFPVVSECIGLVARRLNHNCHALPERNRSEYHTIIMCICDRGSCEVTYSTWKTWHVLNTHAHTNKWQHIVSCGCGIWGKCVSLHL